MKKIFILLAASLLFIVVGCVEGLHESGITETSSEHLPNLTAGFAEEETKTYVESGKYLRWHEDDRLTAFFGNTRNRQYKFDGATGDNSGSFSYVSSGNLDTGNALDRIYAVYPYDETIAITDDGKISLTLPAVQTYAENSFGRGANTMLAVTENLEDTSLSFKNACGYLKLKLYNSKGVTIQSIEVKGNKDEKIAGTTTATIAFGEEPELTLSDDASTSVTLNCGKGVTLSTTAETATEFWIVLPVTTFAEGLTITVTDTDGKIFEKSTSNEVIIERNVIQPMAALEVEPEVPKNAKIMYTSSDGKVVAPYNANGFGATIISNTYIDGKGVITFDGDVTTIGVDAFRNCTTLTNITIPDSVTTIGEKAFCNCSSLTNITIGDSVTMIGSNAFSSCSSLTCVNITDVAAWCDISFDGYYANPFYYADNLYVNGELVTDLVIPDGVTTIGNYAFYNCSSLTSITIPDSVTSIGDSAFYNSSSLTSVTIGDSVTMIGSNAFSSCSSLTCITIPDSITTVGNRAFYNCTNLQEFKGKFASYDGRCLIIDGVLNSFAPYNLTEYSIPDVVTMIGSNAFNNCRGLTSITIPDSVTSIGDSAFYGCRGLTSITIPDSVTSIGDSAFYGCNRLSKVFCYATVPPSLGSNAFEYNANGREILVYDESVDPYKSVWKSYMGSIYTNHEKCEYVTVINYTTKDGNTVTSSKLPIIKNKYANGVGELHISGKQITIPNYAFDHCTSLTSITIPNNVTMIGSNAFYFCSSLTNITIGDSVTMIGSNAFYNCSSLTNITIGDSVTMIGSKAFCNCSSLTSVTIPDSVTSIGEEAFRSCNSLTNVNITDIAAWCAISFDGGGFANPFYYADNLYVNGELVTDLVIPDGVTTIGNFAFDNCSSLTSVTIGDSVTTIGVDAFDNCSSLTSVIIGDSVTTIGQSAFSYCTSLTNVTIGDSVTTIGSNAFYNCSSLTNITIGDSVTMIGSYAFYNCSSLTNITIGDSVTTIGQSAFYGCKLLTSVYCKAIIPPTIADSIFSKSITGRKIYVPRDSVNAYVSAKGWKEYAGDIVGYDF